MAHLYRNGRNYHVQLYVHGRRRRFSLKTDNYGIARDKVRRMEAELVSGDLERPTRTPVADAAERFAAHLRAHARPGSKSVETDLGRLSEFLGPVAPCLVGRHRVRRGRAALTEDQSGKKFCRRRPRTRGAFAPRISCVEEITPQMIGTFLVRLKEARGLCPKTVNEYREIVQRFFNWLIKTQGVRMMINLRTNPCDAVAKLRVPAPTIRFLDRSQITTQLEALKEDLKLQTIVAMYIYAGLRREEALWLTKEDVDLTRRVIHVRAKTVNGLTWWPKTSRNRVVPISSSLEQQLRKYRPPAESKWFFPSRRGVRWNPDNFSHRLADANGRAGLPWACLDYRHTFGSQLAMKGESLYKISQLLGNSPEICRRHYACLTPESLVSCVEFDAPGPASVAASA